MAPVGGNERSQEITGKTVSFPAKIVLTLAGLPRPASGVVLIAFVVLIGWLDLISGPEVTISLLYAVPIALAVAANGTWMGVLIALVSGMTWLISNWTSQMFSTDAGYLLAMLNRLFYFGVVVAAVAAVKKERQTDEERIRALEERHRLERELVQISEHEQQRIGQDLHDGICQHLAAIGCAARMLANNLREKDLEEAQDASLIESAIDSVITGARGLARGICPVPVDRVGLPGALLEMAKTASQLTGSKIEVRGCDEDVDFDPKTAMHLFRIAQEATGNALRHSGARQIVLGMHVRPGSEFELRIEDDGTGLQPRAQQSNRGIGLSTMRYRAEQVGGSLEISPRPGGGTVVSCRVSMPRGNAYDGENGDGIGNDER